MFLSNLRVLFVCLILGSRRIYQRDQTRTDDGRDPGSLRVQRLDVGSKDRWVAVLGSNLQGAFSLIIFKFIYAHICV